MATIVDIPQRIVRSGSGLTPVYTAVANAADTHQTNNIKGMFLHFKKSGAGNAIVTVQTPGAVDGNAVAELTATVVATTGDKMIGPFDRKVYNQFGQQYIHWTVDDVVGLTVAALYAD